MTGTVVGPVVGQCDWHRGPWKALADAIESILADAARYEQMSRESVQWAEHQSWRNVAGRMRAFYDRVLASAEG